MAIMIPANQYDQFRDYLKQLLLLPRTEDSPRITQKMVGERLSADPSSVSKFLSRKVQQARLMTSQFLSLYPHEVQKWPTGSREIGRKLQTGDALYFLGIKTANVAEDTLPDQNKDHLQEERREVKPLIQRIRPSSDQAIPLEKAPIVVSYRGDGSKDAQGMIFDHMQIQQILNYPTQILIPNTETGEKTRKEFFKALKAHPAQLPQGEMNDDLKRAPAFIHDGAEFGLLFIPGRVRIVENEPNRLEHEHEVIRWALNRGQPILAVCAGAWRLWQQLILWNNHPTGLNRDIKQLTTSLKKLDALVEVQDHNYNGGMLRLNQQGVRAVYNVSIHDIVISDHSHLQSACATGEKRKTVNSVHWRAVNPACTPPNITLSAWSIENPAISKKTRQGEVMQPQEDAVEAYESEHGAPMFGIQWHLEGYNLGDDAAQNNLLKYMAQAGTAYAHKRQMLAQIQTIFHAQPRVEK